MTDDDGTALLGLGDTQERRAPSLYTVTNEGPPDKPHAVVFDSTIIVSRHLSREDALSYIPYYEKVDLYTDYAAKTWRGLFFEGLKRGLPSSTVKAIMKMIGSEGHANSA